MNDIFSRQLRIEDWKQYELENQNVLILGVGGIGSVVLTNLLRLGVKKITIVDYDHVDSHNLNRQSIYGIADIGLQKVESAYKNSQFHNISSSDIQAIDIDAVKNWGRIVELAKLSTAIFNCIDYGDYWDAAVQSLCLALKIPMFIAGSFAQSFMAEIYHNGPCYACMDDSIKVQYMEQITTDKICDLNDISFLPSNQKPIGQSHQVLCQTAGNFVSQLFLNFVNQQDNSQSTKKIIFYMTTFEILHFPIEYNLNCILCQQYQPKPALSQKPEQTEDQQVAIEEH